MWTPKRVLILTVGLVLFLAGFAVYNYFLGGINGLPPLPEDYWYVASTPMDGPLRAPLPPPADQKLAMAFGPGCEELKRSIRLYLRDKGVALAAGEFTIQQEDGRVKLAPFSAAMFPKAKGPSAYPEINTVQCDVALLTLDRPVASVTELANRKVIAVELRSDRRPDITLINNRKSAARTDDLDLRIAYGSLYYEERRDLIWTEGYVKLTDLQTWPHPTVIKARGMELRLAKNSGPNRPKQPATPPPTPASKGENVSVVEMVTLRSNVDMHIWVDGNSGFLAGNTGGKTAKPAETHPPRKVEKSQVVIKTNGPFTYDLTKERAWFDAPPRQPGGLPAAPEHVLAARAHPLGMYDQIVCDHLELQFRRKPAAPGAPPAEGRGGDKEIDEAWATTRPGKEVVLTMDTEKLEAYGNELYYRAASTAQGPQTTLKGTPMRAVKEGHKIVARELHLTGADKDGNGQHSHARGPGQIDLFDKGNPTRPYTTHIVWQDLLTTVKERDGTDLFDLLTVTGQAAFLDDERSQDLRGERILVWVKQNNAAADTPTPPGLRASGAPRQQIHKVLAFDKVSARSPDAIIRRANRLTVIFRPEVASGDRLPDVAALAPPSPGNTVANKVDPTPRLVPQLGTPQTPGNAPVVTPPAGPPAVAAKKKDEPKKPIELTANEVVMYVSTQGTKKQLQDLKAEGNVFVEQEGDRAGEKKVEIQGQLLTLHRYPATDCNHMEVFGEKKKLARLVLGDLKLWGPKVTLDQRDNKAEVDGQGALDMPSDKNFDGTRPSKVGTRMTIWWNERMEFDGKDADFYGGVQGKQDDARLVCKTLHVTLDRHISFKEGQTGGKGAKVDKLLADQKVAILDRKVDRDKNLIEANLLEGAVLDMDNLEGATKMHGPGRVRHLAMGSVDVNAVGRPADPTGQKPAAQEMKLTRIDYRDRMWSNSNARDGTKKAKFYGEVEVFHFPATSLQAVMNPDRPPKNGFYLRSDQLDVAQRKVGTHTSQTMIASGHAIFNSDDCFGKADIVEFNEELDQVIFKAYKGKLVELTKISADGKRNSSNGETFIYHRKTGKITGGSVGVIKSSWLRPRDETPKPLARAQVWWSGRRVEDLLRLAHRELEPAATDALPVDSRAAITGFRLQDRVLHVAQQQSRWHAHEQGARLTAVNRPSRAEHGQRESAACPPRSCSA